MKWLEPGDRQGIHGGAEEIGSRLVPDRPEPESKPESKPPHASGVQCQRLPLCSLAATIAVPLVNAAVAAQTPDGAAIFARDCASCHDGAPGIPRPSPDVLKRRSPEAILSALTAGGMRPQGGRLSGAERRAVAEYLSGRALGGDVTGATIGRCTASPPLADPAAAPAWSGWSPSITNTRFQSAAAGRPHRRAGAEALAEVGVRLSRRDVGLVAADRRRRARCSSAARTARCTRSTRRAAASTGRSRRRAACGRRCRSAARRRGRLRGVLRRHRRQRLRARRGDRHASSGRAGSTSIRTRGSPGRRRSTGACCTCRSRRWRKPRPASPATSAARSAAASNALDAKTGATCGGPTRCPKRSRWARTPPASRCWGPSGVGIWSAPTIDVKRGVVYAGTGNTYSGAGAADQPTRIVALRPEERRDQVDQAAHGGRRVRLPRRHAPTAARRRVPISTSARRRCWSPCADGRDIIVARRRSRAWRTRIDPGQAGRVALAVPRRRRIDLGRHSVGRGGRRRARLLPGVRHPHAETRRAARGRRQRPASAPGTVPPPPLKCAPGAELQRRADLGADTHPRRAVLRIERRRRCVRTPRQTAR